MSERGVCEGGSGIVFCARRVPLLSRVARQSQPAAGSRRKAQHRSTTAKHNARAQRTQRARRARRTTTRNRANAFVQPPRSREPSDSNTPAPTRACGHADIRGGYGADRGRVSVRNVPRESGCKLNNNDRICVARLEGALRHHLRRRRQLAVAADEHVRRIHHVGRLEHHLGGVRWVFDFSIGLGRFVLFDTRIDVVFRLGGGRTSKLRKERKQALRQASVRSTTLRHQLSVSVSVSA